MGSGALRASVFGASDGLVSNLALVLGVASASSDGEVVVLAGVSGLLAGACSMALGEWISMQAQKEAFEQQLAIERNHLERYPEHENEFLRQLLMKAGLSQETTQAISRELQRDLDMNLGFHARLELGIDPEQTGSPGMASLMSFLAFAVGAVVPLLPWLVLERAMLPTMVVSGVALFAVGALLSRYTRRTLWFSGARQLGLGALAAGVTMAIGSLF